MKKPQMIRFFCILLHFSQIKEEKERGQVYD
jgi:hypothetical protein